MSNKKKGWEALMAEKSVWHFVAVVFSSNEVAKKWQQCQTFVKIGFKIILTAICCASEMKWQGFHIMKTCLVILGNHALGVPITYLNGNNTHKYCLLQNRMKMASKPKKCGSCPSIFKMPCIENKCLKINWQTFNDFCLTHRQQQKRTIR